MQARLIVYPPDNAAIARWVDPGRQLRIGRSHDSDLTIDHPTISRFHAELVDAGDAWILRDLDSKNGSFIDGSRIDEATLPASSWLRFGDVHCELSLFEDPEAERLRERERSHRAMSQAMTRRIADVQPHSGTALREVLSGVLELAGCSRGFLLVARGGDFEVQTACGLEAGVADPKSFAGSVGAVQRTVAQRAPLVVNQVACEPWLAGRDSVVAMQLHSVVCVPLFDGERVLGVVYADRREAGEPITDLDLDLLHAFCENAAVWLLAGQAIHAIEAAPRWNTIVSRLAHEAPA